MNDARHLLLSKIIQKKPFLLAVTRYQDEMCAPFHLDTAKLLSDPGLVQVMIAEGLKEVDNSKHHCVTGALTLGLPLASIISLCKSIPLNWVRKTKKGYTENRLIEGDIIVGSNTLVVDDFFVSGKTLSRVIEILEKKALTVTDFFVLGILSDSMYKDWQNKFSYIQGHYIFTLEQLIDKAIDMKLLPNSAREIHQAFLADPYHWQEDRDLWQYFLQCKKDFLK